MFAGLDVFRLSFAMTAHAGQQQAVTAANIANADTPGFRARTIDGFSDLVERDGSRALRATRPGHLSRSGTSGQAKLRDAGGQAAPNGNTVSLEREMLNAAQAVQEQARALAIYQHGLSILRLAGGR